MSRTYDAIVVGARCAGSPTAMLLARMGQRVLLLDRASFPSDTISTHLVHPPGVDALARWGLLDRLVATGCPPIRSYSYDFGPFEVTGSPSPGRAGGDVAYGPRRTVLDEILVNGAVEAGVEVRQGYTVQGLLVEDGRVVGVRGSETGPGSRTLAERADIVVGADGRNSVVARCVAAPSYRERPAAAVSYYAYWHGLPASGFEVHIRPERAVASMPTHDGLTCLVAAASRADMKLFRSDIEGNYLRTLEAIPGYADRVRAATRESPYVGMAVPSFYRQPYGPGWALVGDAGHDQDPCTAQGITNAFADAAMVAQAWGAVRSGTVGYDEAMADYQRRRDERTLSMHELTCQLSSLEPPPPEQANLLGAMAGNTEAMRGFVSMIAGTLPVGEFYSEANVSRILAGATAGSSEA